MLLLKTRKAVIGNNFFQRKFIFNKKKVKTCESLDYNENKNACGTTSA